MPGVSEAVKCRCGLQMQQTAGGAYVCRNCDQCQPQEQFGMARNKTKNDVRFETYWIQFISKNFVDNTKPEVGNPNPDETEGE